MLDPRNPDDVRFAKLALPIIGVLIILTIIHRCTYGS